MKNKIFWGIFLLVSVLPLQGQQKNSRVISTVAPLLLINSDARSAGMGDAGVATSSDENALYHNAAKMAFNTSQFSGGFSYTPWLQNLVDGLFIGGGSLVNRIDERSAWGLNLRYFSLGKIELFSEGSCFTRNGKSFRIHFGGCLCLEIE
jgi:hypothetical protein